MTTMKSQSPLPELDPSASDGRRRRSDRSRRQIIDAMFALLREGEMSPSAAQIAERANVGLRTVFRHFEDMDGVYHEMTDQMTTAILPKIVAPYKTRGWRNQLFESVDKYADIYETVFPVKICLSLRRFQSDFLSQQYDRDDAVLRASLQSFLPASIVENRTLYAALEAVFAFSTWRRLRQDQNLSIEDAKAVIALTLNGLIAHLPND